MTPDDAIQVRRCRHCGGTDAQDLLDLGFAPPSNAYLRPADLNRPEVTFPLRLFVCRTCRLAQTEDYARAEALFEADYAYFSSTSRSWLEHASAYVRMITERLALGPASQVIELASNDGYLLRNFVTAGIPCIGVEPTHAAAEAARVLGIEVIEAFFGTDLASSLPKADLIIGNNVYAHVPDINDFTAGMAAALKPEGVITLEFPHLLNMIRECQFDTAYHEHFSYLSLLAVERIMAHAGLRVFDVETLTTHGGSLRIYACRDGASFTPTQRVTAMRSAENAAGLGKDEFYAGFQNAALAIKHGFLDFLLTASREGRTVAGYGAAAKGNTLMNFAGVRSDLVRFVCDKADSKIGKYLPGSHIPIRAPETLEDELPDYLIIFPWNIAQEVMAQLSHLREKGMRVFVAVPEMREL